MSVIFGIRREFHRKWTQSFIECIVTNIIVITPNKIILLGESDADFTIYNSSPGYIHINMHFGAQRVHIICFCYVLMTVWMHCGRFRDAQPAGHYYIDYLSIYVKNCIFQLVASDLHHDQHISYIGRTRCHAWWHIMVYHRKVVAGLTWSDSFWRNNNLITRNMTPSFFFRLAIKSYYITTQEL